MEKTILDIIKIKNTEEIPVYNIKDINDIMQCLETHLNNYNINVHFKINVGYNSKINTGLLWSYGFGIVYNENKSNTYTMILNNYKMWCYYKDNKAIYFDNSGVLCENPIPPHISLPKQWHSPKFKEVLKNYDRFELIQF